MDRFMQNERGSLLPNRFPSLPGAVFPLYHLFADLADADRVAPAIVSAPARVAALTLWNRAGERSLLLGNLTTEPLRVLLRGTAPAMTTRWLTPENVVEAMTAPEPFRAAVGESVMSTAGTVDLDLPPCALVRLDESSI